VYQELRADIFFLLAYCQKNIITNEVKESMGDKHRPAMVLVAEFQSSFTAEGTG
jgi:hypothetical protein